MFLYDDGFLQAFGSASAVQSKILNILSYAQVWMQHPTLDIKFTLTVEAFIHMAGVDISSGNTRFDNPYLIIDF